MTLNEEARHPLLATRGVLSESQMDELQDEISEEAFQIYERHRAAGQQRSPQDDWSEARAIVLARHVEMPETGK